MKDIKSMLESGKTPDELKAMLDREIEKAQDEIDAERKISTEEIDAARAEVVYAAANYLSLVGLLDKETNTTDFRAELYADLVEFEPTMIALKPLLKLMIEMEDKEEKEEPKANITIDIDEKDADKIINTFLKGII